MSSFETVALTWFQVSGLNPGGSADNAVFAAGATDVLDADVEVVACAGAVATVGGAVVDCSS